MKLFVDIRSLMHGHRSGVENYLIFLLSELVSQLSKEDEVFLWWNNSSSTDDHIFSALEGIYPHPQITLVHTRIPNKLFHLHCILPFGQSFKTFLRKNKIQEPDLIFIPDPRPFLRSSLPIVSTIHDLSYLDMPQGYSLRTRVWHWMTNAKKLSHRSAHCICVSHFTQLRAHAVYSLSPKKSSVIYEGPCIPNNWSDLEPHIYSPYFVTLSTLEPRKNLKHTIETFLTWNKEHSQKYTLKILGKRNDDIFKVLDLPESPYVEYTGFVSEEEKVRLIKGAHGLIYLSLYEGFGLPVLEAMTMGTPVIASNTSSIPEVVGKGGFLVSPTSVQEFHNALTNLSDSRIRDQLSALAIEQAGKFSWKKSASETLALFYDVLNSKTMQK